MAEDNMMGADAPPADAAPAEVPAEASNPTRSAMLCVAELVDAGIQQFSMDATGDVVTVNIDGTESQISADALAAFMDSESE